MSPATSDEPTSARRPRRVALVGAGWIADAHADVLAGIEGIEIALVCEPDPTRRAALVKRTGAAKSCAAIDEIVPGEVDVAHLLVPPALHERLARELLARGIGVFVEKPLALSADAARALGEVAAKKGLPFGVNHNFRFHPVFVRLLEKLRSGAIGRLEHVQATLAVPLAQLEAGAFGHWMFHAPANIVYEQAVHPLSLVHALVGKLAQAETTILSTRELLPSQIFHDRWAVAARAERGTAQIHLSFGSGFEQFRIEARGTDGCLEADLRRSTFSGERKSQWLEFYDGYLAASGRARMIRRDARAGLFGYLRSTLGLARRDDGFFASMRGSIEAFYAAHAQGTTHAHATANAAAAGSAIVEAFPAGARAAVEVLEWCDALARSAAPPPAPKPLPAAGPPRPGEVVVLGANGFIGRRTVEKLLERGLPVTAIVRATEILPREIAAPAAQGRVRVLRGSLEDARSLEGGFAGARIVIHLATGGGGSWDAIQRSMVQGTAAAAKAAMNARAARFVYVSSIAALDTGTARPVEDSLATDARPELRSLYARGKIAAEKALVELHRSSGLPLVIARPGVVLGAGSALQHSGLGLWVRDNHCVGWGRGDHRLPLVWVDDVADALAAIAASTDANLTGKALNLAADVPLDAREVVAELARSTSRDLIFHPRTLAVSYAMEIGKWLVKKVGGKSGAEFPSLRDLRARSLRAPIPSRNARELLGWKPVEDREAFLDRAVRVHGKAPACAAPPSRP